MAWRRSKRRVSCCPAIILMDLALPKMDGWEATRLLKADERTRNIPIVALTGHALAGHAEGARQAGCDAFVTKPCLPDVLVAEIQRMLAARAETQTLRRTSPISSGSDLTSVHPPRRVTTSVEHEAPGRRDDPAGARQ